MVGLKATSQGFLEPLLSAMRTLAWFSPCKAALSKETFVGKVLHGTLVTANTDKPREGLPTDTALALGAAPIPPRQVVAAWDKEFRGEPHVIKRQQEKQMMSYHPKVKGG